MNDHVNNNNNNSIINNNNNNNNNSNATTNDDNSNNNNHHHHNNPGLVPRVVGVHVGDRPDAALLLSISMIVIINIQVSSIITGCNSLTI